MDKINKLPPGIVYNLTGSDSPNTCWVTVGEHECRSFPNKDRVKRFYNPKKIIGRLPPDQLDATEWKEEYRLPKDYDPEKHELWWVSWKGPAHWEAKIPGRYVTGNPHWQRVEEAQPPPGYPKTHPGDQIEDLKKELEEKRVWLNRYQDSAVEWRKRLDELSMIFTGQPYDENRKYTRPCPKETYKGKTAKEWHNSYRREHIDRTKECADLKNKIARTERKLMEYKSNDIFLVWRGWTIKCLNPKAEIGKGPPPVARKDGENPISRDSIPAILDEIVRRETTDNPAKKKSSRFPEIAKWIATIGALGAGIWSIV